MGHCQGFLREALNKALTQPLKPAPSIDSRVDGTLAPWTLNLGLLAPAPTGYLHASLSELPSVSTPDEGFYIFKNDCKVT